MSESIVTELLEIAEDTMKMNIRQKNRGIETSAIFNAITKTEEYLYLRLYSPQMDTDQYVFNFIRFVSGYVTNPNHIVRAFQIFMWNIKRTSVMMADPAIKFMTTYSADDFIMGFLMPRNNKINPAPAINKGIE